VASLTALTIFGRHANADEAGWHLFDIAIGLAACGLVPLLIRRPVPAALAMAALAALSPAATPASTVGTLHVAQRRPLRVAIGVAVAGFAGHLVQGLWRPINGLSLLWFIVLNLAVHAALLGWGAMTQARRALLDSLRERALRAEAEQGRRVAEARRSARVSPGLLSREAGEGCRGDPGRGAPGPRRAA
jgi:hypothetical protein